MPTRKSWLRPNSRSRSHQPRRPRLRVDQLEGRDVPSGFSTYLGGGDDDQGSGVAVDAAGNIYVVGYSNSADIPVTFGTAHGGADIYLAKLNSGGQLLWATLYGGSQDDATGSNGLVLDGSGNLYVTGSTISTDFPTTAGAFQTVPNGSAAGSGFVIKVEGATGAILYSTYLSGAGYMGGEKIAVDSLNNAYVSGSTNSSSIATPGAFQTTYAGGYRDAFAAKLSADGGTLIYATLLGGASDDFSRGIVVDQDGNACVAGRTSSTDFPTTAGAFQPTNASGNLKGFVVRLAPDGSALSYSTYLGGSSSTWPNGIAVDAANRLYVSGNTSDSDFPTTSGALQTSLAGTRDAFLTRFDPAGAALEYSTYLGGSDDDNGYSVALDAAGRVYLHGSTRSTDFPTTPDAIQGAYGGDGDGFVVSLNLANSTLSYSTYLGGAANDLPYALAVGPTGNIYLAGLTSSTDFPVTPGALQTTYAGGGSDMYVTKLGIGVDLPPPTVTIDQAAGQADPTNAAIAFGVVFDAPVTGFDASDIDFSGSTVGGTPSAAVTGTGTNYTVTVTGMAGTGTVVASIPAGAAVGGAGSPTLASTSTDNSVTFDGVAPAVTIEQRVGQPDPTNAGSITFDVVFSESVTGFSGSDVEFAGSTAGGTLNAVVTGSGTTYTVTVTGMSGLGTVVASIPAGAAPDAAGNGNAASTSTDNSVTFDESPTVTVNQAAGQPDPTGGSSIDFIVVFSEPVTGFDASKVSFAGSTAGGTIVAVVSGTGPTYTVTVTGMTTRGDVVVSISAGAAADLGGNPSEPSTSTDNGVTFLHAGTVSLELAADAAAEGDTRTFVVHRAGGAEGAVTVDYSTVDGTALRGSDFPTAGASGTLSWVDGETADKSFTLRITDDTVNEWTETFTVRLSNPTGGVTIGSPAAATVTIGKSDGATLSVDAKVTKATFADADGDKVTVSLGGNVAGSTLTYYLTDGAGPIAEIDLAGTDPARSTATVSVARKLGGAGDGRTAIGEVNGTGLKSLSARTADLTGAGIRLTGFLGSLTIGDVTNGADIVLAGAAPALPKGAATRITAGVIGDGTDIAVAAPLGKLTAVAIGDGTITAPSVGSIKVTGRKASKALPAVAGDFKSDLTVSGVGIDPVAGKALKALTVKGTIRGSTILVGAAAGAGGNVGSVAAGGFVDSRLFAGYDGTAFTGNATVGSFVVTGTTDAFARSFVIASNFKNVALGSAATGNGGTRFGFVFDTSFGGLTVKSPKLGYNRTLGGTQQMANDLWVVDA